jgi:hypothetical protein
VLCVFVDVYVCWGGWWWGIYRDGRVFTRISTVSNLCVCECELKVTVVVVLSTWLNMWRVNMKCVLRTAMAYEHQRKPGQQCSA